jgi:hypothetical protein
VTGIGDARIAIVDLEFEIAIYGVYESQNGLPSERGVVPVNKFNARSASPRAPAKAPCAWWRWPPSHAWEICAPIAWGSLLRAPAA